MLKFSLKRRDEPAQTERRFPLPEPECETGADIVARLRSLDNRTPFAKGVVLEAAVEIDRLRDAIRKHRRQVWGDDEPDHASDAELYRTIG